ncbi:MAG: hypothetical protein ACRDRP_08805 [Pseudonocardiaceae bacterium]
MSRPDIAYLVGTGEYTDYRVRAVFAATRTTTPTTTTPSSSAGGEATGLTARTPRGA